MRPNRRLAERLCATLACFAAACAGPAEGAAPSAFERAREVIGGDARDEASEATWAAVSRELEMEADASGSSPARRFWSSYLLARLHSAAADEPFLTETSSLRERIGPLESSGEAGSTEAAGRRLSQTSHLVASLDHARRARLLLESFDGPPPPAPSAAAEPALRTEELETNLALLIASSYARLGFRQEVSRALDEAPRLLEPQSCLAFMEEMAVRPELRPWVCEMVSVHLRGVDVRMSYRFAVMAIEGATRFGHALPRRTVDDLEDWILSGAGVRFVCPLSQTGYIPGRQRSPLSGIRHFDYVPVAR